MSQQQNQTQVNMNKNIQKKHFEICLQIYQIISAFQPYQQYIEQFLTLPIFSNTYLKKIMINGSMVCDKVIIALQNILANSNNQLIIIVFLQRRKMEFLTEKLNLEQLFNQFFKPIRKQYSNDALGYYLNIYPDIIHSQFYLSNQDNQRLVCSLFLNSQKQRDTCIIYLHGSGSNRFQSLQLLHFIPVQYSLFSLDFSGSGRSEGDYITFGEKEKYDLQAALKFLRGQGFKKFILWGRSMGANTIISFVSEANPSDILLLILDSPFFSFEAIALQMAQRKTKMPDVILQIALNSVKKHCEKYKYNPFSVQAKCISNINIPTLFVYSENDSIISWQNSEKIIKHFKSKYERIIIEENHNIPRTQNTLMKIFKAIQKFTKVSMLRENNALQNRAKGINLVKNCGRKQSENGIWVSMKFTSSKHSEGKSKLKYLRSTTKDISKQQVISAIKTHKKNSYSKQQEVVKTGRKQQVKIGLRRQCYL